MHGRGRQALHGAHLGAAARDVPRGIGLNPPRWRVTHGTEAT